MTISKRTGNPKIMITQMEDLREFREKHCREVVGMEKHVELAGGQVFQAVKP